MNQSPKIDAKILTKIGEKVPATMKLLRRWRVIGRVGEALETDDLTFLGRKEAEAALKSWAFLIENVVADVEQVKATRSGYFGNLKLRAAGKGGPAETGPHNLNKRTNEIV